MDYKQDMSNPIDNPEYTISTTSIYDAEDVTRECLRMLKSSQSWRGDLEGKYLPEMIPILGGSKRKRSQ